ncbi:MAG: AsnC family protein [Chromatiales bacterium]|nr:AsnC family protein [Chromatiales bacterium]
MDMIVTPSPLLADERAQALISAIQDGLPLVPRPYAAIGERIGLSEQEVIECLRILLEQGVIKRLGVVVRHRPLGYDANAMVVWDVPDERVQALGVCLGRFPFVTLCYRRPRRLPVWPYNLFTMIHGRDREQVLARVAELVDRCDLGDVPHQALFSRQCFKQRGARYGRARGSDAGSLEVVQ